MSYQKDSGNEDACSRNENASVCLWAHKTRQNENIGIKNRMKVTELHRKIQEKRL
jgi:hypothetical protein